MGSERVERHVLPITVSVLFIGLSRGYMLGKKLQLQGRLPALPCACLGG